MEQEVAITEGIVDQLGKFLQGQAGMQQQLDGMQQQLDRMQQQLDGIPRLIHAITVNAESRQMNRFPLDGLLIPLVKEIPGAGDVLLRTVRPLLVAFPDPLPEIPAVGIRPKSVRFLGCFPTSVTSLEELDHHAILLLIQFYNDGFGILLTDNLQERRQKFRNFTRPPYEY